MHFTICLTSQLVMAVAARNVNFVNVYMIAYRVHVYTRTSLIHSPNPKLDSVYRRHPAGLLSIKQHEMAKTQEVKY